MWEDLFYRKMRMGFEVKNMFRTFMPLYYLHYWGTFTNLNLCLCDWKWNETIQETPLRGKNNNKHKQNAKLSVWAMY